MKKATVKATYLYSPTYTTLSVKTGESIATKGTITFVDPESEGKIDYQILINKTVADMKMDADGKTYTYDYEVEEGSELVIAVGKKTKTVDDGYKITFEQGDHYTIFGITSGSKYKAYVEEDEYYNRNSYDVVFSVIPDSGYIIDKVSLKGSDSDSAASQLNFYNNRATISASYNNVLTSDSTILVETTKGTLHNIEYVGKDDVTSEDDSESSSEEDTPSQVDWDNCTLPKTFIGGEQVVFSFVAKDGYGITGVSIKPWTATALSKDYSYYVVSMPNEDVTIDVYTAKRVALALTANEHISNVGFYASKDYEDGGFSLSEPITGYNLDGGTAYVAFDVEDGYIPTGLVGIEEYGQFSRCSVEGKAKDGRYVISFSFSVETTLAVKLATAHSITLDGSCDKVYLEFDDDTSSYAAGDEDVSFKVVVKDEYASSWRVKSVTACYGNTEDELVASYDGSYSIRYMPDADVTIKVEMYQPVKTTVSYSNTAGDLISSVRIRGLVSGSSLGADSTSSASFEEGETLSIDIEIGSDHTKEVNVYYVENEDTTKEKHLIDSNIFGKGRYYSPSGSFKVPEGGISILIEAGDDATPLDIDYPSDAGIKFYSSTDSSTGVDSLTVYPYDTFYFTVDKTVADDEKLVINVMSGSYSANTETVEMSDGRTATKVEASNEDITIELSTVKMYSFTATTTSGEDASDFFFFYDPDSWTDTSLTNGKILTGMVFNLKYPYYSTYEITSITIGGEKAESFLDDYTFRDSYTVTGDVVITVAPKTAE